MSNIVKQRLTAGQSVYSDHPSADALSAFIEQGLKESERQRVLGHLASCAECRQSVALAAPEATGRESVVPARGLMLRFPAAMRWASVAAVLAVAAGIGVLSVEQESTRHQTEATAPAPVSSPAKEQPQTSDSQNREASQDQLISAAGKQKVKDKEVVRATVRKKNVPAVAQAGRDEVLKLDSRSSSVATVKRDNTAVTGTFASQPEMHGNTFAAAAAPSIQSSQVGTSARILPPLPPPPSVNENVAVASAAQSVQAADATSAPVTATTRNGPLSFTQTSEVGGAEPSLHGEASPVPYKSAGGMSLVGTPHKTAVAVSEFVAWSVTAAGKLQRRLRDGAVKLVEPAPGFIVRAVASHGIEVWAGGSQHDLSARKWQQGPALFHSSDAGETWTKVDGPWHGPINRLALVDSETLTVVTDDGTWTSRDAGGSWTTQ